MRPTRLLLVAALAAGALGFAVAPAALAQAPGVLVGFESGVSSTQQERAIEEAGGRLEQRFSGVRGGRLTLIAPRGKLAAALLIRRLRMRDFVAYAEPDFGVESSAPEPDDPFYPTQYALGDDAGDHDIDAPQAWDKRTGCSKVAVLDSGVDLDHPDLVKNIVTSDDKPGDGKDNDKNGYVDDAHGWNAVKGKGSGEDANGHGTHVAGIIAGGGNNDVGVTGLCWKAKIVPVRFLDERGRGSTSDAIAGIEYAAKSGAKVINCSFGSDGKSQALHDAVKFAAKKHVLLVVAAGNDGRNIDKKPVYPASFGDENLLVVAATDSADKLASFSNFGASDVDVGAPGADIFSTYLEGGYKKLSGTSMAAPYVAAVAAMLRKENGDAGFKKLRKTIKKSVDEVPALKGKSVTGGRLSAKRALNKVDD